MERRSLQAYNVRTNTIQRNITSFFGPKQSKKRKLPQKDSLSSCNNVKSETKPDAPRKTNKSENTKGRRVTRATVEKWKKNDLFLKQTLGLFMKLIKVKWESFVLR